MYVTRNIFNDIQRFAPVISKIEANLSMGNQIDSCPIKVSGCPIPTGYDGSPELESVTSPGPS